MIVTLNNLLKEIRSYQSLAIIGLSKNAGKTTTLNAILKLLDYQDVMLTSIGYDGEESDLIFNTKKPSIFVKANTIIATAKKCVLTSDVRFEIMESTGFNTPLGEIIIARTLNDGFVHLAGPSYNSQLKHVISLLKSFNKNGLVIVDGALNRKTSSDPSVAQACILCSGMSISDNMDEVVKATIFTLNVLSLDKSKVDFNSYLDNTITLIDKDNNINAIKTKTTINQEGIIIKNLTKDTRHLLINGPLTDKLVIQLIKSRNLVEALEIVVLNATNVFVKSETFERLNKTNICIKVVNKINVSAIAMNPNSLNKGYDSKKLVESVKKHTNKFVYDFVGGE